MQEIKFKSHKWQSLGHLFSIKEKKTRTDQSKIQVFYFVQIETTHKLSKEAGSKNVFSSLYVINAACFDECFLFHVMGGRRYFF